MKNKKMLVLSSVLALSLITPAFATDTNLTTDSVPQTGPVTAVTVIAADTSVKQTPLRHEALNYINSFKMVEKGALKTPVAQSAILKAFDKIAVKKDLKAAATFVDKNIRVLSTENADVLMLKYIKMINKVSYDLPVKDGLEKQSVADALGKLGDGYDYDYYKLQTNRAKVKNAKMKTLLQSIHDRNMVLVNSEGMFFYQVNYVNLAKYGKCTSAQMTAYLEYAALDTIKPMSSDGGLIISTDELAKRIVIGDELLKSYKGTKMEKYTAILQINQIWSLVYGLNNTPAFDYQSNLYQPDFIKSYKLLAAESNSHVGTLFTNYLKVIEKHKNLMNDSTRKDVVPLVAVIEKAYGIKEADHTQYAKDIFGSK